MILINDLRITQNHKHLIIDVEIDDDPFYKDVYIESIRIDTEETFVNSDTPSEFSVLVYEDKFENNKFKDNKKKISLMLDYRDIVFNKIRVGTHPDIFKHNIFFVFIKTHGSPSPEAPCGGSANMIMQTVVDLKFIYNKAMSYMRELNQCCNIPKGFINFILLVKAFELNVVTGNYPNAIKLWRKLAGIRQNGVLIDNKCGCNG